MASHPNSDPSQEAGQAASQAASRAASQAASHGAGQEAIQETAPGPVAIATPLMLACKNGHAEKAKELLEATYRPGSSYPALTTDHINIVDEEGETALTRVIASKMTDIALLLMARGAEVDVDTTPNSL